VNKISDKSLWEFHHIYDLGTVGNKDDPIRFYSTSKLKGQGLSETKYFGPAVGVAGRRALGSAGCNRLVPPVKLSTVVGTQSSFPYHRCLALEQQA